jgi:UDP-glucose 4-epimerase
LIQEGYDILLLDNLYNSKVKCLERIEQITKKEKGGEIKFVEADLKNYEQIEKVVEGYKPTACIHFAALKAVGESVSKPLEYYDNNISGTINLMKALHKH